MRKLGARSNLRTAAMFVEDGARTAAMFVPEEDGAVLEGAGVLAYDVSNVLPA